MYWNRNVIALSPGWVLNGKFVLIKMRDLDLVLIRKLAVL